jgi:hypothetical protein
MIVSILVSISHKGEGMAVLVIASGSVTTTEPNLYVRQSRRKIQVHSPDVDRRFSFAQEVGQILLGLESTISFQEVEARDFFMSAIK